MRVAGVRTCAETVVAGAGDVEASRSLHAGRVRPDAGPVGVSAERSRVGQSATGLLRERHRLATLSAVQADTRLPVPHEAAEALPVGSRTSTEAARHAKRMSVDWVVPLTAPAQLIEALPVRAHPSTEAAHRAKRMSVDAVAPLLTPIHLIEAPSSGAGGRLGRAATAATAAAATTAAAAAAAASTTACFAG